MKFEYQKVGDYYLSLLSVPEEKTLRHRDGCEGITCGSIAPQVL